MLILCSAERSYPPRSENVISILMEPAIMDIKLVCAILFFISIDTSMLYD